MSNVNVYPVSGPPVWYVGVAVSFNDVTLQVTSEKMIDTFPLCNLIWFSIETP